MFYCDECGNKRDFPTDALLKSLGPCHFCGVQRVCNDIKASDLPTPQTNPKEVK